jgi:hypothetical protein
MAKTKGRTSLVLEKMHSARKLAAIQKEQMKARHAKELLKIKNDLLAARARMSAIAAGRIGSGSSMKEVRQRLGTVVKHVKHGSMTDATRKRISDAEKRLRRVRFAPLPVKSTTLSLPKSKSPAKKTVKPMTQPRWR